MTLHRPSPIEEGVKKGKTQIIPVGSINTIFIKIYVYLIVFYKFV